jgi:asparagine synthase (glutamine-hydrolysing)
MCGICGIYEYGRTGTANLQPIAAMTEALAHRGPDDNGVWYRDRVALGHRRLSIFDLSSRGAQPMLTADERLTIAFNGEIYNFPELREPLERDGYPFRTGTDTEVLLAHYQRHGIGGLSALRGMFAFALWDETAQCLYLVRDRLGVKPLYYSDQGGVLLFASEIKALLKHPDMTPHLDRARLKEWLALRYTVAPNTLFEGISKLEPGCYLRVTKDGVSHRRYWDIRFDPPITDRRIAIEGYRERLTESVRLRLRSDVPVGVFLSGGLDSSTVALEAAEQSSHRIRTFTVGYRNHPEISELGPAKLVADYLGAEHHELILDEVGPETLAQVVEHLEEPIGDPATVLLYQLAELTRQHVKVALTGEGSDETNLGYEKAWAFRRWAELGSTPVVGGILEALWLRRWVPGVSWRSLLRGVPEGVYAELSWPSIPHKTIESHFGDGDWFRGLQRVLASSPTSDRLSQMLYLDIKCWMSDDLLLKVDKMTMAHALEARVPFLDHELVEWNMRLPPAWKVGTEGTKLLLREIMRGRLPAETVARPQHGFLAPLRHWFSGDCFCYLDHLLGMTGLAKRGVVPDAHIASIRRGLQEGEQKSFLPAFMLAALECWFQKFGVTVGD